MYFKCFCVNERDSRLCGKGEGGGGRQTEGGDMEGEEREREREREREGKKEEVTAISHFPPLKRGAETEGVGELVGEDEGADHRGLCR